MIRMPLASASLLAIAIALAGCGEGKDEKKPPRRKPRHLLQPPPLLRQGLSTKPPAKPWSSITPTWSTPCTATR